MFGLLIALLVASNFNVAVASANDSDEGKVEGNDQDWKLVWSDEFDGDEINMDNWSFDHPENGRYNQEIQSYTDRNAWVEDGKLIIEARDEEFTEPNGETYNYTSSKLITQGKQTWTYGKIEVKAKMPTGQGMWPAIWMMPEDEPFYGTWPVGGEIDIMELLGHEPGTIHGNIHYGDPKGESQGSYTLPDGQSFADDYHVYTLEWEPGEIRWYIDGELFNKANDWHSRHPSNAEEFTYPAPFDQDFFLILNISVGGGWPGNPDETTVFPQQMAVDYVRVYQKDEYPVREKPEPSEEESEGRAPLKDGNFVYNGGFNSDNPEIDGIDGVANTDYWTFLKGPGGDAEVVVEDGAMHIQIANGGTVDYGVQLIQDPIPLEQGAKYKASFNAKAESERDIKVKLGGGDSRGYSEYSNEPAITLSTDWEPYEFEFIMPERTDLKARYEFNMGLSDADVWLSDVRLEMVEKVPSVTDPSLEPRPPLAGGNFIYNGTFDQGAARMAFWEFKTDSSADADKYIGSAVNERRFDALINNGGDHAQSIQLVQPEINVEQGNSYQLTFDASADAARSMQISLVSANGNVVSDQTVDIDTETKDHTIHFDVDVVTDNNVELQFNMGGSNENVYIDNVVLTRVLESDGVEGNLILNGIFDSLAHWTTEFNHSQAVFGVDENGHFKVNITDVGYDTWAIQLYQSGVYLEQGEDYELSLDARSTIDRPVLLQLEHGTDYTTYFAADLEMTEEWDTYKYTFTMDHDTDPNTKFGFSFGGDGTDNIPTDEHDIFIDNIVLKKVGENDPPSEEPDLEPDEDEQLQDLLDQITNLEARIKALESESNIGDLEKRISSLEEELLALRAQYNNLEGQNSAIEEQIFALQERIEVLKEMFAKQVDEEEGAKGDQAEVGDAMQSTDDDQTKMDENAKPIISSDNSREEGDRLPETATTMFNWLVIGFVVLLTGTALALFSKRKSFMIKKKQ